MKQYRGSISIYFVFAITLIISVVLSVTEIARMNCQKLYLQIATDTSLDSMASLYHRKLYQYYNLYGVEYRTREMLDTEYLEYLSPYFIYDDRYIKNWYVADVDKDKVELDINTLVENDYFEREIVSYEKLNLVGKTIKFLGKSIFVKDSEDSNKLLEVAKGVFEEVEKSSLYGEVQERYFDFFNDIKTLEDYGKKISDYVDKVNIGLSSISSISTGGSKSNAKSVLKRFEDLNENINKLANYLLSFKQRMNDFRNKVSASYRKYSEDRVSGEYEFSDEIVTFIESEFEHFLSYVDENSDMNNAIEEGIRNTNNFKRTINEDYKTIRSYVNEYELLEERLKEARSMSGEDADKDEVDSIRDEIKDLQEEVSESLKDIKENYEDLKIDNIRILVSNVNHSDNENLLKKLVGFKNGIAINLILDKDVLSEIKSEQIEYSSFGILSKNNSITIDKIMLGEYELDKFHYFNKELNEEITKSGSQNLEVERLISGKTSDLDNLKDVINKILFIRIAMNVIHIYMSSDKRSAARQFTSLIFSGFSPIMVEAMFILMITAWGTAQGIVDMQNIMKNKRVNFMHDDESWTVSVESILRIAGGQVFNNDDNEDTKFALNYKDYLRLLLIKTKQSDINSRMVGIIQYNIMKEQSSFNFEKLIYSFNVKNTFYCRHFFTNFLFVLPADISLFDKYVIKTEGYRSFYENKE